MYFSPQARSTFTTPCFRYETRSITVLFTRSEVHPHNPLLSVRNEVHNCTFHPKRGPPPSHGCQMQRWANATVGKCNRGQMQRWANATVGKCDGGQMRRWANATVGKCNGGQMQQCAFFCGQRWPKVAKGGQRRPKVAKGGQRWPKAAKGGQRRPKAAK